jgi:hypothetical protein
LVDDVRGTETTVFLADLHDKVRPQAFTPTELESAITTLAVVVAAEDGRSIRATDTGVFVGKSLILTAKRVVMHFWDVIAPVSQQRPDVTSKFTPV